MGYFICPTKNFYLRLKYPNRALDKRKYFTLIFNYYFIYPGSKTKTKLTLLKPRVTVLMTRQKTRRLRRERKVSVQRPAARSSCLCSQKTRDHRWNFVLRLHSNTTIAKQKAAGWVLIIGVLA